MSGAGGKLAATAGSNRGAARQAPGRDAATGYETGRLEAALREALARVCADPTARGRSPAYRAQRDMRLCPSAQLRMMHWLVSGPALDGETVEQLFRVFDRSTGGGCFEDEASAEAFEEARRLAVALLAAAPAAGPVVAARIRAVQSLAPYVAAGPVLRLPKLTREASDFDTAGQALTERAVEGRVMLVVDPIARALRPQVPDAAIRLLARAGYDVDVPPGEQDFGWVRDWLGQPADAARQMAAHAGRWQRTLERARDDDRPRAIEHLIALGPAEAELIRKMPARLDEGAAAVSPALGDLMAAASDVVAWLCNTDIGPPVRWSSLRIGLLASGDGRTREIGTEPRLAAIAALVRDAGYSVRPLAAPFTASGGPGLVRWLAPDLVERLQRHHLARVRAGALDVLAVDEAACIAALSPVAPCPVVHVVELLDWAYGGPVPAGLADFANASTDLPMPNDGPREAPAPAGG